MNERVRAHWLERSPSVKLVNFTFCVYCKLMFPHSVHIVTEPSFPPIRGQLNFLQEDRSGNQESDDLYE